MKKLLSLVIVVLFGALLARTCLYTVNEREYALVFMLGELKSVVSTPGLHVKLPSPLQNVVYLDKRILTIDTPAADLVQTSEKKNLIPMSSGVSMIRAATGFPSRAASALRTTVCLRCFVTCLTRL